MKLLQFMACVMLLVLTPAPTAAQFEMSDEVRDEILATLANAKRAARDGADIAEVFRILNDDPRIQQVRALGIAESRRAGEPEVGWSRQGLDFNAFEAAVKAEKGSAYLFGQTGEVYSIDYDGEPQALLSDSFVRHVQFEQSLTGDLVTSLTRLSRALWLETVSGLWSIDNAVCTKGIARVSILTHRPISTWSDEELVTTALFVEALREDADREDCYVFHENEDGTLGAQRYTPDGRLFVEQDEFVGALVGRDALDPIFGP